MAEYGAGGKTTSYDSHTVGGGGYVKIVYMQEVKPDTYDYEINEYKCKTFGVRLKKE